MNCFQFEVRGRWAHFKRPETSNNPQTHDMITKTALIGMIGAVLGIERTEMRELYPVLSEDLLYNIQLLSPVIKVPIGLTSWRAIKFAYSPKNFEMLKAPAYLVTLALYDIRSGQIYDAFKNSIKNSETVYPPVLGWHNCPAELVYKSEGLLSDIEYEGEFTTSGFVPASEYIPELDSGIRIGLDRLPTHQNNDFWNNPEQYKEIVYPEYAHELKGRGHFRIYSSGTNQECLCLI